MPILETRHDFGHAFEADPNWSESYYFNAYSPSTDTGLFARVAVRPNEPHVDGFITLWLPGGDSARIAESRSESIPSPDAPVLNSLGFERIEPMQRWRIRDLEPVVAEQGDGEPPRPARVGEQALQRDARVVLHRVWLPHPARDPGVAEIPDPAPTAIVQPPAAPAATAPPAPPGAPGRPARS